MVYIARKLRYNRAMKIALSGFNGPVAQAVLAELIRRGHQPENDAANAECVIFFPQGDNSDNAALEAINATLEGKTDRRKNPHPKGTLAYVTWVCAAMLYLPNPEMAIKMRSWGHSSQKPLII